MLKEAMLYKKGSDLTVLCHLCNHNCSIKPDQFGICGVRQNRGGRLYTHTYAETIAAHVDPIEKKPLYHFLPGTTSFSIATIGCNFRCVFCQNWQISQITQKESLGSEGRQLSPEEVVAQAQMHGCKSISYTYTEPTIFFEYAYDTCKIARNAGLRNVFVTNGYMTAEALEIISPYLDASNVDLKSFNDQYYRQMCNARLGPVLDSIRKMKELNIWVEITTLIVPGENDGEKELIGIAKFIADLDPDIPWHISRFHPDYQCLDKEITPIETLHKALSIGKAEGLRYVYIGNVFNESENTLCPRCQNLLIQRKGFSIRVNKIKESLCPACKEHIPGVF